MYAIMKTGGKQYKVEQGDELYLEKLGADEDETVIFDQVVAVSGDDGFQTGTPFVKGASVTATVLKNGKAKKIRVFTYKPKKGKQRTVGHRQPYTKVRIEEIQLGGAPVAKKPKKASKKTTKAAEEAAV